MEWTLLLPIAIPVLAAGFCQLFPRKVEQPREWIALIAALLMCLVSCYLFLQPHARLVLPWFSLGNGATFEFDLNLTPFAKLTLLAASVFTLLTVVYSIRYMEGADRHRLFYVSVMGALGMTCGVALSNQFVLLLLFWELLGLFLFLLVLVGSDQALPSATKTLLIIGGADLAMLLGFSLLWSITGRLTFTALATQPLQLTSGPIVLSFSLILVGVFAKGGVIPFHGWIPAIATDAPIPVMALMPAAIDKLVAIYLLGQMVTHWFILPAALESILMGLGAATILSGVLMALIQSDYRKMLAFHNVSQVGYMLLGIGTGTTIGIAGGILHMLNLVILKGSLFLSGGAVERQTRHTRFDDLGGLANAMPWTYASTFIAALGISGLPPLNAFVSKWLIYQGIIEHGGTSYIPVLLTAMFGSALTLASFMKLMHSIFWGERPAKLQRVREAAPLLIIPSMILSLFVIGIGIFYPWILRTIVQPILSESGPELVLPGIWQSGLAVTLLLLSLAVGALFYLLGRGRQTQAAEVFVGGEDPKDAYYRVSGAQFYGPIKTMRGLGTTLHMAEEGAFDLYNYMLRFITWGSRIIYEYIDQGLADLYQEVIPGLIAVLGKLMQLFNARLIPTYILWALYALSFTASLLFPQTPSLTRITQIIACVGMVGWGMLAWVESDLTRLSILAATSQIGFVVLGATLSAEAAFSYLLTGGAAIAVLLLCGRSITHHLNTGSIQQMNGLASRMPIRFSIFLIAALWLSGLPPFGSFYSKYLLGVAAEPYGPLLSIVIAGTAFLTLGYFLRPIRRFLRTVS